MIFCCRNKGILNLGISTKKGPEILNPIPVHAITGILRSQSPEIDSPDSAALIFAERTANPPAITSL